MPRDAVTHRVNSLLDDLAHSVIGECVHPGLSPDRCLCCRARRVLAIMRSTRSVVVAITEGEASLLHTALETWSPAFGKVEWREERHIDHILNKVDTQQQNQQERKAS